MCVNLSDISAMGAKPKTYNLNLSINSTIDKTWLKRFSKHLSKIQKNTICICLEEIFRDLKRLV